MNSQKRTKIFILALVLTLAFSICGFGAVGSDEDPLISLSYITNVVMPYIDNAMQSAPAPQYEVVEMNAGAVLTAGASTELILRSGKATVSLQRGAAGGFTDITDAKDLNDGSAISANHQLICPRADGRRIYAETKVYIMVRGSYTLN